MMRERHLEGCSDDLCGLPQPIKKELGSDHRIACEASNVVTEVILEKLAEALERVYFLFSLCRAGMDSPNTGASSPLMCHSSSGNPVRSH